MHSRDNRDITWTLNSTPQPLQPHDVISQKYTRISTMWTDQEKSCHTVNKMPLTKSRLDCRLLLSPATTDYSRLLQIIKDPSCWFSQSAYIQNALDSNHFPLFVFLGLVIGCGKKSQISQDFQRQIHGKICPIRGNFQS